MESKATTRIRRTLAPMKRKGHPPGICQTVMIQVWVKIYLSKQNLIRFFEPRSKVRVPPPLWCQEVDRFPIRSVGLDERL